MYINLENMFFISLTLCQICLFEFIRVEGGVKFMKHIKGGGSYKTLGTSSVRCVETADMYCFVRLFNNNLFYKCYFRFFAILGSNFISVV
jgi:hypothetical protein